MTPRIPDIVRETMARWGKKGGESTSKEKAEAARENGTKGGRPRVARPNYMAQKQRESRARRSAEARKKKKK